MRNYSNQNSGKPSGPNRGGYRGQGGPGRDHREHREHRDDRGGHRGGNRSEHRPEHRDDRGGHRGEHRSGGQRSHSGPRSHHRSERPEHRGPSPRNEEGAPRRTGGSWVEVTGRTPEEAIEEASRRFNVGRGDLKTETVEEGSRGFLGLGSKPARVRISLKGSAVPPFAEGVLSRLLRGMSLPDTVKVQKDSDGNTVLNIQGPSSGTLIGRHGHTLESLQYLVSKVVQRMTGDEKALVVVDVENYLERQKDKLKELALSMAEKAKETGAEVPMRPMSSKDRRVVHLTLKDHEHVKTESRGEGLRRKVVILPKNPAPAAQAPAEPEKAAETAPEEETPSVTPVEVASQSTSQPDYPVGEGDAPEPGNAIPPEKEVDDNIGNRA